MPFHRTHHEPITTRPSDTAPPTGSGEAVPHYSAPPMPRFLSVPAIALILDVSEPTLYRAIQGREFPAIKIRGRYVIPSLVLDAMEKKALETWSVVDAADWVDRLGAA